MTDQGEVATHSDTDAPNGDIARPAWTRPRKLLATDDVADFYCGRTELDDWLKRYAIVNQRAGMTNVYITQVNERMAGFYALASGGVEPKNAPDRAKKGVAKHPIPVVILTRLAVHEDYQGLGLGRRLLKDALLRTNQAAEVIGVRALLIHAKDLAAKEFYLKQGEFEESPTDKLHLWLLMKDLRAAVRGD